jgi:hypothetical protein
LFQIKASQSGSRATRLLLLSGGHPAGANLGESKLRASTTELGRPAVQPDTAVGELLWLHALVVDMSGASQTTVNLSETLVGQWCAGVVVAASRFAAPAVPTWAWCGRLAGVNGGWRAAGAKAFHMHTQLRRAWVANQVLASTGLRRVMGYLST